MSHVRSRTSHVGQIIWLQSCKGEPCALTHMVLQFNSEGLLFATRTIAVNNHGTWGTKQRSKVGRKNPVR